MSTKTHLLHKESIADETKTVNPSEEKIYGEEVKIVNKLTRSYKIFTPAEKTEVEEKYKTGMNMTEIAKQYGCHHTTISKILRQKKC